MSKIKLKVIYKTDILLEQYLSLVEQASHLEKKNPKEAMAKLLKASLIETQIEELKIARNN